MKVDGGLEHSDLRDVAKGARDQEASGYDGIWTAETSHDPFFPLVLASEHTERVQLGTSIAVAFARNPMSLAVSAYDLNNYSRGRFILGLGSQVRAHIEKRFSMPWSSPADRMREFVLAMRAVWHSFMTGERLDFRGEFYSHTLLTPFFDPGPTAYGPPKVFLAAVGQRMTEVAGEVADGLLVHSFTTERYLREVTLPAIERGLARAGRSRADFEISYPSFIVTGRDEQQMAAATASVRERIAFYASTPAYRPVLEVHGWGDLQTELNRLSKSETADKWKRMGDLVDDDVVDAFAVVAEPERLAAGIRRRYGDLVDRVSFYAPGGADPATWPRVLASLRT